jgi:hypothetical protein
MTMKITAVLILVTLLMFSCSDEPMVGMNECTTPATVRNLSGLDGCGWVFELTDGTRLEPFIIGYCGTPPLSKEITEDPLYDFEFVEGKQVKINYELQPEAMSVCMVGPIVRITCLQEVSNAEE